MTETEPGAPVAACEAGDRGRAGWTSVPQTGRAAFDRPGALAAILETLLILAGLAACWGLLLVGWALVGTPL